jgi:hypothetical protein
MKKLAKSFLMLSMASMAVLSSCKKEDDNAEVTDVTVTISPSPSASILQIGTVLTLTVEATGNPDNQVTEITVTSSQSGGALLSFTDKGTSFTKVVRDTIMIPNATYTYTVTVKGEKGNPATKSYTVQSVPEYGFTDALNAPIDLYGQTQDLTFSHFMQLVNPFTPFDGESATYNANKANIDLCFFYGTTNKFSLASPSNTSMQGLFSNITWTGAKVTALAKTNVTAAQYDAIVATESDSAILAIASGVSTWTDLANNLTTGNVLVYKTAAGKKGLVKVVNTSGTNASDAIISVEAVAQR